MLKNKIVFISNKPGRIFDDFGEHLRLIFNVELVNEFQCIACAQDYIKEHYQEILMIIVGKSYLTLCMNHNEEPDQKTGGYEQTGPEGLINFYNNSVRKDKEYEDIPVFIRCPVLYEEKIDLRNQDHIDPWAITSEFLEVKEVKNLLQKFKK